MTFFWHGVGGFMFNSSSSYKSAIRSKITQAPRPSLPAETSISSCNPPRFELRRAGGEAAGLKRSSCGRPAALSSRARVAAVRAAVALPTGGTYTVSRLLPISRLSRPPSRTTANQARPPHVVPRRPIESSALSAGRTALDGGALAPSRSYQYINICPSEVLRSCRCNLRDRIKPSLIFSTRQCRGGNARTPASWQSAQVR